MQQNVEAEAERLVKKLKICIRTVQGLVIGMLVCLVALIIFWAVASVSGLREHNPVCFLAVVAATGGAACLCCAVLIATFIVSGIYLKRLKALGPCEPESPEEKN